MQGAKTQDVKLQDVKTKEKPAGGHRPSALF